MRIVRRDSVYEAAQQRIRWVFDEFDDVIVNWSGGKDSTAVFWLALDIATELDRLPLRVYFCDTEAEWQATIDLTAEVMYREDVDPLWLQVPMRVPLGNDWFHAWDEAAKDRWMRPKEPIARTENVYGADRFIALFTAIVAYEYPDRPVARLAGVRAEESPARRYGLTIHETHKGETWGRQDSKDPLHLTFNPLYDWCDSDVWKYIADRKVAYNRVYDLQFQYGVSLRQMRVPDLHGESRVGVEDYLQDLEPDTYARLIERFGEQAKQVRESVPAELPFMFATWPEYRDYLLEHLIPLEHREPMARRYAAAEQRIDQQLHDRLHRVQVRSILVSDFKGTLQGDFESAIPK